MHDYDQKTNLNFLFKNNNIILNLEISYKLIYIKVIIWIKNIIKIVVINNQKLIILKTVKFKHNRRNLI